ncbi:MAG: ATPase domain-containing protein [Nanoarchaeota archaeon]|nr:AAA family ATPase [Nanoarchaeota archaeon]MBU1632131.1 AAA family ATPase [Nanoarchaeota archaeon]MBU1876196.1 AAA family ATPase [Nanoarchaeota archaeon]
MTKKKVKRTSKSTMSKKKTKRKFVVVKTKKKAKHIPKRIISKKVVSKQKTKRKSTEITAKEETEFISAGIKSSGPAVGGCLEKTERKPTGMTSKKKARRISTGIKNLDPIIGGGFKENSINLVAGDAGSGKTIFAIQFLLQGIKNKEKVIYLTFEEKKSKLYKNMLGFGWDLEALEKKKQFHFLEYTPEKVKKLLMEGGGEVENLIEKTKAKRLVIDSITSFALLYEDPLEKKEASLELFELINKWGCTAVLTAQAYQQEHTELSTSLEFEVDSIILLYHIKKKGIRKRALEILKMRGTKIPEKTIYLDITNKGLAVNPKIIMAFD